MTKFTTEEMQQAFEYVSAMHILFETGLAQDAGAAMSLVKSQENSEAALTFAKMSRSLAQMGVHNLDVQQKIVEELLATPESQIDAQVKVLAQKGFHVLVKTLENRNIPVKEHSEINSTIVVFTHDESLRVAHGRMTEDELWAKIHSNLAKKVVEIYGETTIWTPRGVNIHLVEATEKELIYGLSFEVSLIGE